MVPFEQFHLNYLKVLAKNLNETLKFGFGDLIGRLRNPSEETKLKSELDAFFAQMKNRFSHLPTMRTYNAIKNLVKPQNTKIEKNSSVSRLIDMRSKFINKMPFLDLPFDLKTDLDATLSDVEAQEFVDLVLSTRNVIQWNPSIRTLVRCTLFVFKYH